MYEGNIKRLYFEEWMIKNIRIAGFEPNEQPEIRVTVHGFKARPGETCGIIPNLCLSRLRLYFSHV